VHLTAERYCRRFGPIYRVAIGPRTVVVVGDPDVINAILRAEALEDVDLGGVAVPAGTNVLLLTRYAATQDASFPRPTMFDPDRWSKQETSSKGFLTFGAGPRFCPGRKFSFTTSPRGLRVRLGER
jgi:hypothetical protein